MSDAANVAKGEGYAVANLDDRGEGSGFREIRKELGVTAFGVNAIVLPPSYSAGSHYHDEQEELYFLHSGRVEIEFGDGSTQQLGEGRVPDPLPRSISRYLRKASIRPMPPRRELRTSDVR